MRQRRTLERIPIEMRSKYNLGGNLLNTVTAQVHHARFVSARRARAGADHSRSHHVAHNKLPVSFAVGKEKIGRIKHWF
jgi:hypothetical protein